MLFTNLLGIKKKQFTYKCVANNPHRTLTYILCKKQTSERCVPTIYSKELVQNSQTDQFAWSHCRRMFACSFDPSVFRSIVDAMYGLRVAFGIHQPFFGTREAVRLPDEFFYRTRFIFNPGLTFPPLFEYPGV
ncbi:hypothetical protein TNCT_93041 [Trichonephila clavata]|uniref:Uncharacterized protein n=1 Tax=Trichonephila clavata TaxID=2740835 RepID=A0A8X6LU13_TRICU|nr:hypothetical protein TNCT_93041 [Trichonephila clavata]